MLFSKVLLQLLIIEIVLRISTTVPTVADMTPLMLLTAMCVKLVVTVEAFLTKSAFRMALEARLIYCTWLVVASGFVPPKLCKGKRLVLMSKHLLVTDAQVAHDSAMFSSYVFLKMWP